MTQKLSTASRPVTAIELGKDKNIFQQIFSTSSSLRDCISRIDQLFLNLLGYQNNISFASGMSHANDRRSRRHSVKHVSRVSNGTRSHYDLSIRSTPLYRRYRVSYVLSLSHVCRFKGSKRDETMVICLIATKFNSVLLGSSETFHVYFVYITCSILILATSEL